MSSPIDLLAEKHGFTDYYNYSELPVMDEGRRPQRQLQSGFVAHATIEKNLPTIFANGLKPRSKCLNQVWSDLDDMPSKVNGKEVEGDFETKIINCRDNNVYVYDDIYSAIEQGLVTVAHIGYGDPAILLIKKGTKKFRKDIELEHDPEDGQSLMYKGTIPPEDIACFCTLDPEKKPDTGVFLCPTDMNKTKKDCWLGNVGEEGYGELEEYDSWQCRCKHGAIPHDY